MAETAECIQKEQKEIKLFAVPVTYFIMMFLNANIILV